MPRISLADLRLARSLNKFLPPLLPVCRDLNSAQSELQWLREHAQETCPTNRIEARNSLLSHVRRRSRHEPLQYILGSEFFADLEIKCRPGVLIPRQETALSVAHLVHLLSHHSGKPSSTDNLRVIDLCTGTGCIPLLFHHDFYKAKANQSTQLQLIGVDISTKALRLARENQRIQLENSSEDVANISQSLRELAFLQADILADASSQSDTKITTLSRALQSFNEARKIPHFDVLISNPPYIAESAFRRTASRSVRHFEPKLALVPPRRHLLNRISGSLDATVQDGDAFYPRLFDIADELGVQVLLFEVGDMDQAIRVAAMSARRSTWDRIEIWRDEPADSHGEEIELDGVTVTIKGRGHGRSVFACRGGFAALESM